MYFFMAVPALRLRYKNRGDVPAKAGLRQENEVGPCACRP